MVYLLKLNSLDCVCVASRMVLLLSGYFEKMAFSSIKSHQSGV